MHLTDWSPGSMSTSIKADVLEQVLRKRRNLPGKFTPQPQRPQAKQIFIWHYSHTFDCWSIYTVCDHPRNQHMVCTDVRLGCTEPVLWGCSAELTCSALISFQFLTLSTDLGGFGREALDNEHEKKSGVVKLKFLIRSQLLNLVLPGASSESVPTSLSLSLSLVHDAALRVCWKSFNFPLFSLFVRSHWSLCRVNTLSLPLSPSCTCSCLSTFHFPSKLTSTERLSSVRYRKACSLHFLYMHFYFWLNYPLLFTPSSTLSPSSDTTAILPCSLTLRFVCLHLCSCELPTSSSRFISLFSPSSLHLSPSPDASASFFFASTPALSFHLSPSPACLARPHLLFFIFLVLFPCDRMKASICLWLWGFWVFFACFALIFLSSFSLIRWSSCFCLPPFRLLPFSISFFGGERRWW